MRLVSRIFTAAAVIAMLALAAVPAAAAESVTASSASFRPDARIRFDCLGVTEWRMCNPRLVGDDVYNDTARGQKRTWNDYFDYATEPDPRTMWFRISIQNEGTMADRFKIDADGVSRGYRVRFFRGSTDITGAVELGTYVTPPIAPGSAIGIKAKVSMNCDPSEYCGQDRGSRLVTVTSTGNPAAVDAVRFVRQRWICTC